MEQLCYKKMTIGENLDEFAPSIFVLHGLGTNENALIPFVEKIGVNGHYYFVRGPLEYAINGRAFFNVTFTPNGSIHNADEASYSKALLYVLIQDLKKQNIVSSESPIVFLGFSQGAIMSYAMAFTYPDMISKVIGLNGRVLQEVKALRPLSNAHRIKIHALYGSLDEVQPLHYAEEARLRFNEDWIDLNLAVYEIGHVITSESIDFARNALLQK